MADDKLRLRAREVARKFLDSPEWYDLERDDDEATAIGRLLAAFAAELVAEARVEEAKDCEFLASTVPFRCHSDKDVEFHSGCVQTREGIRDELRKHKAELEATLAKLRTPQTEGGR